MVRDFFSKLLRREISSFVRISVTVTPFTWAAARHYTESLKS
jgi:hypothetical protein